MPPMSLLGVPWDASSSFERGAAEAPPRIRAALWSPSSNAFNEAGDDLRDPEILADAGDLLLPMDPAEARSAIAAAVLDLIRRGGRPLALGGDHSITYPILRGVAEGAGPPTVLHLDAHADVYDEFEGDRYSHACPFARVMEDGLAVRLVQVGVRTLTREAREQLRRFGVECYEARRWQEVLPVLADFTGPVYVSLDLDVLEPMLAPGIAHPEPGGLSVREVLQVLHALHAPLVGADVVEYNPANDVRDLTARVAAKLVKELVSVGNRRKKKGG